MAHDRFFTVMKMIYGDIGKPHQTPVNALSKLTFKLVIHDHQCIANLQNKVYSAYNYEANTSNYDGETIKSHVKIITDKIKQSPEGNIFVSKVTAKAGALPHTNMMNFFVNCNREFMSLREAYSSL